MKKNLKIHINKNAKYILNELHKKGFEAYIVGGCVRDVLIGKIPDDYDITTNAKPNDIKKIFKKTIDTGIKHGTVSVLLKTGNNKLKAYEVTTYRIDGQYLDGRHPENVSFVKSLKEDLSRRDFTINAMAYNEEEGLIDLYHGIEDLKSKIVRAVGEPKARYEEDALRMLRAIRFSAKLGFDIEKNTYDAIKETAKNISKVSKERIQDELNKILLSDRPKYIKFIYETGLAKYICDGFDMLRPNDENLLHTNKLHIAYTGLLYNNTMYCDKILRELKLDNKTIYNVKTILNLKDKYIFYDDNNDLDIEKTARKINYLYDNVTQKAILYEIGYDLFIDFIYIINKIEDMNLKNVCNDIAKIIKNKEPIFLNDLKINGKDLMNLGYNGKEVGIALKYLLKIVHKNYTYNNKKILLSIAKKAYNEVYK